MIGKFRKLLIPFSALCGEAASLAPQLRQLIALRDAQSLSDAEYATWFALHFAASRVATKKKHLTELLLSFTPERVPRAAGLASSLRRLQIAGMPGLIILTLVDWLEGRINLRLSHCPVTAQQMLAAQAEGWRYVTVEIEAALAGRPVAGTRDAFEFALHDLSHAYTFFQPGYDPQGQVDFFAKLRHDLPLLAGFADIDEKFAGDLEYGMADMNSHPQHLRQYLQGVVVEMFLRRRLTDRAAEFSEDRLAGLLSALGSLASQAPVAQALTAQG